MGRRAIVGLRIGPWLSTIGGVLITVVSAEISYIHSYMHVFLDFIPDVPPWYPPFMNSMANGIGYTGLILSILVMAGAVLSFRKDHVFTGGLASLIFSGVSAIVGVLLWLPPFYVAGAIYLGQSPSNLPFHLFPSIGMETYAPLFFLGTTLGVAGGGVTMAISKRIG